MAAHGSDGERHRHQRGPDPGRRAQPPVADVADAEAILGDRRQQRHRPAEQHREEVERDGREQDRRAADEPQPFDGGAHRRPFRLPWGSPDELDARQRDEAEEQEHGRGGIRQPDAQVVQEARGRRSEDRRPGERERVERDHAGQTADGGDHRWHRPHRRRQKGTRDPEQEGEDVDRRHRRRRRRRVHGERDRAGHLADDPDRRDDAPVEAVGDRARHEHQQQCGQELEQADQPDRQLAVGDVVDLLADDRGLHRGGAPQRAAGEEQRAHAAIGERLTSTQFRHLAGRSPACDATERGGPQRQAAPPVPHSSAV